MKDIKALTSLLNKHNIQFDLEKTGVYQKDSTNLFTHLLVNSVLDFNKLEYTCWVNILKEFDIDFISVNKPCVQAELTHITSINNLDAINEQGLHIPIEDIGDLGKGIYFIDIDDIDGKMNLEDYLYANYSEDTEIGIVTIEYTGMCVECILGDKHEEYIVIKEPIKPEDIINIDTITVEEFEAY